MVKGDEISEALNSTSRYLNDLLNIDFGRTLRLLPYFMCENSEGFADRQCDKYHNLMSWLIW